VKALEESVGKIVENSVEKAFTWLNQEEEISVSKLLDIKMQKILNDIGIKFIIVSVPFLYLLS